MSLIKLNQILTFNIRLNKLTSYNFTKWNLLSSALIKLLLENQISLVIIEKCNQSFFCHLIAPKKL